MIFILFKLGLALFLLSWAFSAAIAFYSRGFKAWRYPAFFPFFVAVVIARYPAAPLAIWLYSTPDRLYLTRWRWLETIDNTLAGDYGHQTEHMIGSDPLAWYNRMLWLWRNGGNRFNYEVLGVPADNLPDWAFWSKTAIPLFAGRFLDLRFGWSDSSLQGRRKYVLTVRIKTKP
jgi:hypothetical protein